MTLPSDPARWTASPEDAPEELRPGLSAASREGPSDVQMKMLALKLAALSAGTVAAASAATAKAAATTAGGATAAKTAGTLTVAKVLASLAIAGVGTAGVVAYRAHDAREAPAREHHATPAAPEARSAPEAPVSTPVAPAQPARAPSTLAAPEPAVDEPAIDEPAIDEPQHETARTPHPKAKRTKRVTRAELRRQKAAARRAESHPPAKHTLETEITQPAATPGVPSEVELLRRARAALASRPREAFALTEQHREHYARGTFAQERDALAIEALMRAGEMDMARDLARRFVRTYPHSPHAHRFRETMGLD